MILQLFLGGILNSLRFDIHDLNNVPEGFHVYCIEASSTAIEIVNAPVNQWGVLITMYISKTQYQIGAQIYIPVLLNKFFFRSYYSNGGWRTWEELQKVG